MFAVLVYDIVMDEAGAKRYQQIHKLCVKHGYHVNYSVFEFDMPYANLMSLIHQLEKLIDVNQDSIRVYLLGKRTDKTIKILGVKNLVEIEDSQYLI